MAQIIGLARIGRDAEVRYTQDGTQVAGVSLAFNYGRKDPNTGNKPTQWVDGSLWGQRAESLAPYLKKGTKVVVTLDDPHIEDFQRQDGTRGSKLVGRITAIEFASHPESASQPQPSAPVQSHQPPRQQPAANPYQAPVDNLADMDDDIPF